MNLLYLSHVSWSWTKQRPQFLAEELSCFYEVTYIQESPIRKYSINNDHKLSFKHLWHIPLSRYSLIRRINNFIYKIHLLQLCCKSDIIWFTSPKSYNWIFMKFFNSKITVYDCMDDMIELYPTDKKMGEKENLLYSKARVVFSSSSHLAQKLKRRYGNRDVSIVNNAISANFAESTEQLPSECMKYIDTGKTIITYIGSISSWMDFELLKAIKAKFPQIVINLWGPPHDFNIPEHDGINLCGKVEYKYVSSILSQSDILIMPFVVNELIESVNPVKLYEYIFSGKPCIAPKYGESMQFQDYVNLYESHEECLQQIEKILNSELSQKSIDECRAFVKNNTWENRVEDIKVALNSIKEL